MDIDTKIRFRPKDDESGTWHYALTIAKSGIILSSTTDAKRAGVFSNEVANAVAIQSQAPDGPYKKTVIESF